MLGAQAEAPAYFDVPGQRIAGAEAGARRRRAASSIAELVGTGEFTVEGGHQAGAAAARPADRPTAIFALSDEMAFGAVIAARDLGLAIPDDVSLIGVDDHEVAEVLGLTTVRQRVVEHGALAARALLRRLGRRAPSPDRAPRSATPNWWSARLDHAALTGSLTCAVAGYESVCSGPGPRPATARGISMRKRWLRLAAVPVAFAFVAAACSTSDDDDDAGGDATEAPAPRPTLTGTEAPADDRRRPGTEATGTTTAGTEAEPTARRLPADPGRRQRRAR